jgi:hypothetical protein
LTGVQPTPAPNVAAGRAVSMSMGKLYRGIKVWLLALAAAEPGCERLLGGLGAVMVAGNLAERLVRRRLLPSGLDAAE